MTSKSVDRYCLKEEKWFSETDMTESRTDATAAVLNGKIYVVSFIITLIFIFVSHKKNTFNILEYVVIIV